ncbi:RCC1 domain-containing protein 1 isoform X1 [Emydura macquarii macquarii]|uniref:RCC1 domain-containing protein 1 isoform X1 n=1 Tax=Emydura macquarii macquarii TaxID=1129001 RepID=UPI00352B86C0
MADAGPWRGWFVFGFRGLAEPRRGGTRRVEPEPGGILAVRPAWSYTGLLTGRGRLALRGPLSGRCAARGRVRVRVRDLLPSETHLLLQRGAALEAWPWPRARGAGLRGEPAWLRRLRPGEAAGPLPLAPGGYVTPRPPFLRPLPPALRARKLVLGHEHAALLGPAGTVYTWGSGRHGQLGHGGLETVAEPRPIEALHGLPMGDLAAGGWHSAGVSEAGDLYVWGWNESGQLALPCKALAEARPPPGSTQEEAGAGEEPCCRAECGTGPTASIRQWEVGPGWWLLVPNPLPIGDAAGSAWLCGWSPSSSPSLWGKLNPSRAPAFQRGGSSLVSTWQRHLLAPAWSLRPPPCPCLHHSARTHLSRIFHPFSSWG